MNIEEFSKEYLLDPLGVKNNKWSQFP